MQERVIITKPQERCGVYAIINLIQKKVYIGESMDLYQRLSDHIRNIMFGLENNGSNNNLVRDAKESGRTFEVFPVLFSTKYDKSKTDIQRNHDWIIDETIYMYLFRKYGFKLYNGEDGRDNVGGERKFLIDNELHGESLNEALENFLNKAELPYSIEQAEKELDKDLYNRFGKTLCELSVLTDEEMRKVWDERAKSLKLERQELVDGSVIYALEPLTKKNVVKLRGVCNELLKERLKKEDMERCGVRGMDIGELISLAEYGELDRIAFCKFGHYLDQSPVTILTTKCYDIKHNRMIPTENGFEIISDAEEGGKGVCFWAFKKKPKDAINYLSKDNRYPKYVIMPYTTSDAYKNREKDKKLQEEAENIFNPYDGEKLEDFFIRMWELYEKREERLKEIVPKYNYFQQRSKKQNVGWQEARQCNLECSNIINERMNMADVFAMGYSLEHNNGKRVPFPKGMFPEIISKWSVNKKEEIRNSTSVAFLISEICYLDIDIKDVNILPFYWSSTNEEVLDTMKGIHSKCCAELSEDRKGLFLENLKSIEPRRLSEREEVQFLIAKLEYPYIIALANDPVD